MTEEDMIAELVSHDAVGLWRLAVDDYAAFEQKIFPFLVQEYNGLTRDEIIELYKDKLGQEPDGPAVFNDTALYYPEKL